MYNSQRKKCNCSTMHSYNRKTWVGIPSYIIIEWVNLSKLVSPQKFKYQVHTIKKTWRGYNLPIVHNKVQLAGLLISVNCFCYWFWTNSKCFAKFFNFVTVCLLGMKKCVYLRHWFKQTQESKMIPNISIM